MFNPDYFLFGLGILWTAFAAIQDIRTKEVANWLTYSLIFFGLFYRLSYSIWQWDVSYIVNGIISCLVFVVLAYIFYYGRVFAGGDAKLLMGIGALIPGQTISLTIINGLVFVFMLLLIGALWSIIALFTPLVPVTRKKFAEGLKPYLKYYPYIALFTIVVDTAIFFVIPFLPALVISLFISLIILGYPCLKAADKGMMQILPASKLTEGDWLFDDIYVGRKTIAKTVHGLSITDIKILKKAGMRVKIKAGVPFVPAFFLSFLVMVFFWINGYSLFSILVRVLAAFS
jgi:Flp pilus assembly protein protease CpaA